MPYKAPDDRRAGELVIVPESQSPAPGSVSHRNDSLGAILHGAIAKVMNVPATLFTEGAG